MLTIHHHHNSDLGLNKQNELHLVLIIPNSQVPCIRAMYQEHKDARCVGDLQKCGLVSWIPVWLYLAHRMDLCTSDERMRNCCTFLHVLIIGK